MIHNEQILQLIWICIFSAIFLVFLAVILRIVLQYLLEKNFCNLQNIFSNTRILQTSKEKKICNALDVSLQKTFKESNIHRMLPVLPQFMASASGDGAAGAENHWPLFQVAVNGKILNPELLIATRAPDYASVTGGNQNTASAANTTDNNMLTDYYRNNMQQMDQNSSLNRHTDNSYGHGSYGSFSSDSRVPVDRPLFINTSMSAQQRVDIYRQLSDPPKDSEPALAFNYRHY
ncbi:unnamed protein product [Caenorhabditis nigoni]